jgi:hypoxanthine phosphoribosyltransferase
MSLIDVYIISCGVFLLACIAVAVGFYLYIKSVKRAANTFRNKKSRSNKKDVKEIIESQEVESDGVLATSSTFIGVVRLEIFARNHKPKYIIGVNRGGWLLSTYLAHRLNIDRNHLLRFDSDKNTLLENEAAILIDRQESILLIDDISRTGNSLQIANRYLKSKFPNSNLSIAALVVCDKNTMKEEIIYSPYYTKTPDIELPWSSDERKEIARERNLKVGKNFIPISDENALQIRSPILRISHHNNGEGIDIVNNDVEAMMKVMAELTA